ncbi:adenylate/guanylate cyclase domain-containing protein [Geminicoccaceae bacterium 1502E]|nr:adenylate/guanylate cyclase domain-containing protein [Geminicoccaceae bacterium 1502E]
MAEPARTRGAPIALALGAATALLLAVAVGLVLVTGYHAARLNTAELVRERSEFLVRSVVEHIRGLLDPIEAQLTYLAGIVARERLDLARAQELGTLLTASLAAVPHQSVVAFASPDLRVLRAFRNRPATPAGISDWGDDPGFGRAIARAAQAGDSHWGRLFVAQGGQMPFANLFVPVRGDDGALIGTLIAGVSIGRLSAFLGTLAGSQLANVFVLQGRDAVLAHPLLRDGFPGLSDAHPLPSLEELGDPVLERIWAPEQERLVEREADFASAAVSARVVAVNGRNFVFLFRELDHYGEQPWVVGTYLPLDEAVPQLRRLTRLLWIGWIVLLLGLGLALLLGRALSRPIRRLAASARQVRELELEAPPARRRGPFRELNEAAEAFNAMIDGLRLFAIYVPRSLVRRLMQQAPPGRVGIEEREVSVLFSDIVGFTGFAERRTAPEVAAFLNRHFTLVDRCVEASGGIIDKYIGDSVMAFWGAPGEQPDHACRACRAALAMAAALRADNAERAARGLAPVRIRVGIHSGPAVVGDIGAPGRMNYTVVGDVVNVAERLEELARGHAHEEEGTTILVSADTADRLEDGFALLPLGRRVLRGRAEPLEVFELRIR